MTEDAQDNVDEAKDWANDLENGDLEYYSDSDDSRRATLPKNATIDQLQSALEITRFDAAQALKSLANGLEQAIEELAKLKQHRHDTSKPISRYAFRFV